MDDEVVYINYQRMWFDDVLAAQYARLWMKQFCQVWEDGCGRNGYNGPEPDACPEWCDSDFALAAYTQGLSRWFGDIIQELYPLYFDYVPYPAVDHEYLSPCSGGDRNPRLTAGLFTAALRDVQDIRPDSHGEFGDFSDRLALGYDEIIEQAKAFPQQATGSRQFLHFMLNGDPDFDRDLWETAMNSGLDIDFDPPDPVWDIVSSHTAYVPSPDGTIDFTWVPSTDDASGVAGYSVLMAPDVTPPDSTQDIGPVTAYTTEYLTPGTWWFMIRAVDRAGNWNDAFTPIGPYTIMPGEPADLEAYARLGWVYPVVPRMTPSTSANSCPVPTALTGEASPLYFNICGRNRGGSATSAGFGLRCLVDGQEWGVVYGQSAVVPSQEYWSINRPGPGVRGGRHTFEGFHDCDEVLPEPEEENNRYARQWIWSPVVLTAGTPVSRSAPPDPEGGWESLPSGVIPFPNCDGYRFASGSDWRAVWVLAADQQDDYNLRLHSASTGPTAGFGLWQAEADRGAGRLDAVVVNGRVTGSQNWDVGLINAGRLEGASDYSVELAVGTPISCQDSLTVTMDAGRQLLVFDVQIAPADLGWLTLTARIEPATEKVRLYWFDTTFNRGDLLDRDVGFSTDAGGWAISTFEVTTAGQYGLVLGRDPMESTGPVSVTIEVNQALADLRPVLLANWYAPLVPRPAPDGTLSSVALPDTLYGNQPLTWFNAAVINSTPAGIPLARRQIELDGVSRRVVESSWVAPYTILADNLAEAYTVRGGRHTLSLVCDPDGILEETKETDNVWAEQFVWGPLGLSFGTPLSRAVPPSMTGGWADLPADSLRIYNCDGLRLPPSSGHFMGVAVMPTADNDVDVRLHDPAAGAKQGFAEVLAHGHQGPGHAEYVAANLDLAGPGPFDAGVINTGGRDPYTAEAVESTTLAFDGDDMYGPFTLGPSHIMDLYALYLGPGDHTFSLADMGGDPVDWELRLHPADEPFFASNALVDSLVTLTGGPGEDEIMGIEVPAPGWYCLVVNKTGIADLLLDGAYLLRAQTGAPTAVEDQPLPAATGTALVAILPNPFNPSTRIVVDLAAGGNVRLELYDARGHRVRSLVTGFVAAGRREFTWDGRDEGGRMVATGTYFARFEAGEVRQTAKLTLLK